MSDSNATSHTEATRGSDKAPERPSSPEFEPAEFNSELNAACLAVVENYRSSKLSLAEASLAIGREIGQSSNVTEEQGSAAYKAFFEQLREHDKLTAASAERGKGVADVRPATPLDNGSDSDDHEEHSPKDVQPVSRKRGPDDEGDRADSGKRRVDESLVPFAQFGDLSRLGPELQATLKLKENYTRNLEVSKQLVVSNPDVPEFPSALWKDVLANNFVDLDKVLSGEYSTSGDPKIIEKFGDTGYAFTAGDIKASKSVRSHGEWIIAWGSYSDAVVFAYPHRQRELRLYSAEITRLFGATLLEWADRVIQFDRACRSRVAKSNRLLLSDIGNFSDLSISHFTGAGAEAGKPPAKAQGAGNRSTSEICRRFNDGICTSRTCKFRHSCFTCKARDHGAHACGKASGSGTQPKVERK